MNEVTQGDDFWSWIEKSLSKLQQIADEQYFQWVEKNLRFNGKRLDLIDKYNAGFICSAIKNKSQLMIILPDKKTYRPALLFGTSLIMQWFDYSKKAQRNSHVLYFGSTVNIRNQLSNIRMKSIGIYLDSFFPQVYLTRREPTQTKNEKSRNVNWDAYLPQVVCIYSPIDPLSILKLHSADWIAVDCEDKADLSWLQPLLEYTQLNQIPLVAWSQNPLSESVNDFKKLNCLIFSWHHDHYKNISSDSSVIVDQTLKDCFKSDKIVHIRPILIDTNYEEELSEAYKNLSNASNLKSGRLSLDALRVGWSFLRTLEALPIPLNLYEAEARNFWGIKQVGSLHNALLHFIDAINQTNPDIGVCLEEACSSLERIHTQLQSSEPPLWLALKELCNDEVKKDEVKVIIFPSAGRKQLFAFALLARSNITEEELQKRRIFLISLEEFRHQIGLIQKSDENLEEKSIFLNESFRNLSIHPLFVGLPSPILTSKLDAVLIQDLDILIYSYQHSALIHRVEQWNNALTVNMSNNVEVLSKFINEVPISSIPEMPLRIMMDSEDVILIKDGRKLTKSIKPLFQPVSPVEEIASLLQTDVETDDDLLANVKEIRDNDITNKTEEVWIEEALEVHFDDNWRVLFAPDETINVIYRGPKGEEIDERYVRSLEIGDRILFIHGQKKQSLYELIISRIHKNPAIEVHLALIRRWHNDFIGAFQQKYQMTGMSKDDLLYELEIRGSSLTSSQTLYLWLRGFVLCPEDPEDLRRLAEALDMTFVLQYYKRIHGAAKRLRGIHRRLSYRLNRWLLQKSTGIMENDKELYESIDDELGLTLQDFRDSLMILQVFSIEKRVGPFYRDGLGKLEKEE